ncbi:NAD(P)/FAD-dependent oxidoreductase [Niveispirillum cyanobacteriorum]|uniref:FAD-dependent oxidoreductase n=1 Tax=Niveispirillum cyanobacteriorum TaxID=1612173 RepID=A0A2K9NLB0_9PROT|nr:FAD-binding oxidoreductase [Niveispirillum cyanobacteriorum]AUN33841.1 FAD-dependent oxidoreductase [Niveispirillum cyanobacteriorum]GGE81781.1 D-amino-acid dehydrogenase [Niveispirillum cyanobacteriorum]
MRSFLVVGGGIVGYSVALALQARGRSVVIVDDAPSVPAASWGNAGHIAVEQVEPLASPATLRGVPKRLLAKDDALSLPLRDVRHWLPFGMRLAAAARPDRFRAGKAALSPLIGGAMGAWERLVQGVGQPDLLIQDGHFVIWDTPVSAARGLTAWQAADTGTTRFRPIDADEREWLTRLLGRAPAGAIRFTGSGHIASHDLLFTALRRHFVERGGVMVTGRAVGLPVTDGKTAVALSDGRVLTADGVVVAAGVASKPLLEGIGHKVPMIAERGYHLHADVGHWPTDLPPLVFEDRALIVTRFRDYLRASSFVEFSHPDSPPDPAKWERLRGRIRDLGLPFPLPAREWVGCRPTLPDYLPAIGRSDRAANLFYAFGHQHLGLTLGPVTGERIAALVTDQGPDLSAFDLNRFAGT